MANSHIIATAERSRFCFLVVTTWRKRPLFSHEIELRPVDEALDRLLRDIKSRGHKPRSILWLLSPDRYFDQVISLPPTSRRHLGAVVQRHLEEGLNPDGQRFLVRWLEVSRTAEEVRVYASATRRETVGKLVRAGSNRKLTTSGIFGVTVGLSAAARDGVAVHTDGDRALMLSAARGLPVRIRHVRLDGASALAGSLRKEMRFRVGETERRVVVAGDAEDPKLVGALAHRGFAASALTGLPANLLRIPSDLSFAPVNTISPKWLALGLALAVGLQSQVLVHVQQSAENLTHDDLQALESERASKEAEMASGWREVEEIRQQTERVRQTFKTTASRPDWTQLHQILSDHSDDIAVHNLSAQHVSDGLWMIHMSATALSLPAVPEFERWLREVFDSPTLESLSVTGDGDVLFAMKMRWHE